ncbi:hypothetical protein SAMN05421820_11486 [Pedobacter steynii]|uniref:Uncharacterized protein n=1 Tax=Pedobacter steynii TaxID=430522 RepID=A0A1H0J632_9SPHI|nr:hypothetical protein [Pedobacter steynii]NQX43037.1 hypothetical protein [Pedobacter steynii]SDO38940.1 hypothetical protein SAMN05421820_11486 [Pedobacter steynii]
MNRSFLAVLFSLSFTTAFSQTNTFPSSGNVGIGTDQPGAKLEIKGAPYWTSHHWGKAIKLNTGNAIQFTSDGGNFGIGATNPGGLFFFTTTAEDTSQPANHLMTIIANGNIGIGTITPDSKLAVNGNIRAREIKVENGNWPDYVFARSYQLPGLAETEKFIKENGHLEGIPSASEVKANGIDLGEMNALLLRKIEELTLHMIEMQKSNELQNTKNEKEIAFLKSKIK